MRILTYTTLFPNSADRDFGIFVYQRASHLNRRPGNEVVAISPIPFVPRWLKAERWASFRRIPSQERIGDITVYHPRYFLLPKVWMPFHALTMFWGSLRLVRKLHQEKRFDVIDAHFVYPDGRAAMLLGQALRVPVIVSARGTDINLFPNLRLIKPLVRKTLKMAAGLIAVSTALKNKMVGLGVQAEKIKLIPNGVDDAVFRFMEQSEARRQLNLTSIGPIVVSVGALVPLKNHQMLIQAFHKLAAKYDDARLYVLGEGPCRPELERLVKNLGLEASISLPGKKPNAELSLWFNAANVSCLASQREGWPNVVTESLACGTPVVATRVGGIPEVLHSDRLGIISEESADSLAECLETALERKWDREGISRETGLRTWGVVASEVDDWLRERSKTQGKPGKA